MQRGVNSNTQIGLSIQTMADWYRELTVILFSQQHELLTLGWMRRFMLLTSNSTLPSAVETEMSGEPVSTCDIFFLCN